MISREEFKQRVRTFQWNSHSDLSAEDSPLWNIERYKQIQTEWFVCVDQDVVKESAEDYWDWCDTHLSGKLLCYISSCDDGEWWGFTEKEDVIIWMLRWT